MTTWRVKDLEEHELPLLEGDILVKAELFEPASDILEIIQELCSRYEANIIALNVCNIHGIWIHIHGRRQRRARIDILWDTGDSIVCEDLYTLPDVKELCMVAS